MADPDVVFLTNEDDFVIYPISEDLQLFVNQNSLYTVNLEGVGVPGVDGTDGTDGTDGLDGALWYTGATDPNNGLGINGDLYLQTGTGVSGVNGDLWSKSGGSWTIVGNLAGPEGPAGNDGTDGVDGADGTDGINGADGAPGEKWYTGATDPGGGTGINGDLYLQTGTGATGVLGDVWEKAGGTWTITTNIRGASGAGTGDVVGPAGGVADGELPFYDGTTGKLIKASGITPTANVRSVLSAADYAAIRTLLGLVIGTNVQAYDADLTTYAGITPSANVQSVLGAADYAAIRTLLGLVIGTNVQAYDADLTTYASITPSANVQSVLGAADYAAIRTLLGLVIGTNVQAQDATLAALAAYNTNGLLAQTAADTFAGRTVTGTANQITVTNGNGVSGNPTLSLPADVVIPTIITAPNSGLHVLDTNASHDLVITPGSDLTADRILTLTTGDAARTVTLSGNPTLSDWFDQSVKAAASPQFATVELGAAADTTLARSAAGVMTIEGVEVVTLSRAQTLTNKTLTTPAITDPVITGTITEDVFTITDAAAFAINPRNGSVQQVTLGASRTPTVSGWVSGDAVHLKIADGTAFTVTWTTIGVVWVGGSAPTLATSGFSHVVLWLDGTTYYGKYVGDTAS